MKKVLLLTALLTVLLGVLCVCRADSGSCSHDSYSWSVNGNYHDYKCDTCGYLLMSHNNRYKTWTADADLPGFCRSSCSYEGCPLSTVRAHQTAWVSDGSTHKESCACGYTASSHTGVKSDAYSSNTLYHWYGCTNPGCTIQYSYTEHAYVYAKSGDVHNYVCTVCSYTYTPLSHSVRGTWTVDGGNHKCVCKHGGYLQYRYPGTQISWYINCSLTEQHAAQVDTSVYSYDADNHYNVCQYSGCGYKANAAAHSFEWTPYDSEHSYMCTTCGYTNTAAHSFKWVESASGHSYVCTDCGYEDTSKAHTLQGEEYTADADYHYNVCQYSGCNLKVNPTAHNFDWVNPDYWYHYYACATCGYEDTSKAHESDNGPWTEDGGNHKRACQYSGCSLTDQHAAQIYTSGYSNDADIHYNECLYSCLYYRCDFKLNPTAHNFDWRGEWVHFYECVTCNYEDRSKRHENDFSPWTEDGGNHKRVCQYSGCSITEQHAPRNDDMYYTYDDEYDYGYHFMPCYDCDLTFNRAAHSFEWTDDPWLGHIPICTVCDYYDWSKAHESDYGPWTEDGGNHKRACLCSGCGLTEQHAAQVDQSVYGSTADNHYNTCEYDGCGLKVNVTAHSFEWTQTDSGHSYMCVTCCYEDTSKAHESDYDPWSEDGGNHKRTCQYSGCGLTEQHAAQIDPSIYSFDADSHCNACQHSGCGYKVNITAHSLEWTQTDSGHGYVCATCGYEDTSKAHPCSGGAWQLNADETLCFTGCTYSGCTLGESHTPAPKAEFEADAGNHWHSCSAEGCTNRLEVTPHTMSWYPTKEGYSYRCSVCGYRAQDANGNSTEIKAGEKLVMWKSEFIIARVEGGIVTMVSAQVYDPAKYAGIEEWLKDGILQPDRIEFLAEPAREADAEYAEMYFGGEAGHIQLCLPMGRMASQMIFDGRAPE